MIRKAKGQTDYARLLEIQIECVESLSETYTAEEIKRWVDYLQKVTTDRYSKYKNNVYVNEKGEIEGFVSWIADDSTATIECLYTRRPYSGLGIGEHLLTSAEANLIGRLVDVRPTLNAESFYEKNGYVVMGQTTSRAGFMISLLEKKL